VRLRPLTRLRDPGFNCRKVIETHEQAATQRVMRSRVDVWCEDIDDNTGALALDCEMVDFKLSLLVSKTIDDLHEKNGFPISVPLRRASRDIVISTTFVVRHRPG
jgi:hypothetical protein